MVKLLIIVQKEFFIVFVQTIQLFLIFVTLKTEGFLILEDESSIPQVQVKPKLNNEGEESIRNMVGYLFKIEKILIDF